MIIYDARKFGGYSLLVHWSGSALFNVHSFPQALASGTIAVALVLTGKGSEIIQDVQTVDVFFGSISFLVGFSIIIRAQVALQRYYNAQASLYTMQSKLTDFASLATTMADGDAALKHALVRYVRLYYTLALEEFQGFEFQLMKHKKELITSDEEEILEEEHAKVAIVNAWLVQSCFELVQGEPFRARLYQILSEANVSYNETRRIAETSFPFPFAQIAFVIIHAWGIMSPIFVSAALEDSPGLAFIVTMIGTWFLFAVNELSAQLEQPMEEASNDLPIGFYKTLFMDTLNAIEHGNPPAAIEKLKERDREEKTMQDPSPPMRRLERSASASLMSLFEHPRLGLKDTDTIGSEKSHSEMDLMKKIQPDEHKITVRERPKMKKAFAATVSAVEGERMALQLKTERDRQRREIAMEACEEMRMKKRQRFEMRHHHGAYDPEASMSARFSSAPPPHERDLEDQRPVSEEPPAPTRRSAFSSIARSFRGSGRNDPDEFVDYDFKGLVELRSRGIFRNIS